MTKPMEARSLNLEIKPRWEELVHVRRRTDGFLRGLSLDRDVVDAVAMVACELGENAIKYGTVRDDSDRVAVSVAVGDRDVVVEVVNRIGRTDEENLQRLDRMVQWIRGYQDPFEAYLQRLKELSGEPLDNTESRLGLVRIAYEGQSVLDFYVGADDRLAVSAIRRL